MNISVLIADDEYFIRQRIKKIIPWEALALSFAGEAENGIEVLELMAKTPVNILILDIKMPLMNGIEAAGQIRERFPGVHIIILSGHSDFEYARATFRHGVKDYLLKPVAQEDLIRALQSCIDSIHAQKQRRNADELYAHYKRCSALNDVRSGALPLSALMEQYPEYAAMRCSLYVGIYTQENTMAPIYELILLLRDAGYLCEYTKESDYIYSLQIFFASQEDTTHMGSIFTEFTNRQASYIFLYIGNLFPLSGDWETYYKRCSHRLTQRYFTPSSNLLMEYAMPEEAQYGSELSRVRASLSSVLNSRDEAALSSFLDGLFDSIREKHSDSYLNLVLTEIFILYHVNYQVPDTLSTHLNEFVTAVIDEEYELDNLKSTAFSYGLMCMQKNEAAYSDIALCKRLTAYIKEHYADTDLSVALLAELFQLNPSYMGGIFKKATNTSILQFITETRLEAAKLLLKGGSCKISEVAAAVGYSDVFYFSKRFKKACGCSPKDYAKLSG